MAGSSSNDSAAGLDHESALTKRLLSAYYARLNQNRRFRSELTDLFQASRSMLVNHPVFPPAWDRLADFVARWRLPRRDGARDVWDSLNWFLLFGADEGPKSSSADLPRLQGWSREYRVPLVRGTIWPNTPLPFTYSPMDSRLAAKELRARAKAIAKDVEASILEQAAILEAEAAAHGWTKVPARYLAPGEQFNREAIDEVVDRLYRRVIRGHTWDRIARALLKEPPSIRDSVIEVARRLDIEPSPMKTAAKPPR